MMNKIVFVILAFTGVCTVVRAQYDFREAEKERIAQANVKTQTEYTHDYKNGQPSEHGYKSSVKQFDRYGNITEEINYNAAGKIISVVAYQYDDRNTRVNHERYQGNREKLQYSQKTMFDQKGNKTREYGFDGAATYSNIYLYDREGKLAEITYTTDNNPVEKRKLTHSGKKTDIRIFDAANNPTFKQENTYNDAGNLLSEIKTDNAGKVIYSHNFEYKDDKILITETKKRGDLPEYQKNYYYDDRQRPVKEETVNADGTKFVSHEYRYNPSGYLEMESWKKSFQSKEASSKTVDYDQNGIYTEVKSYFATYKLYSLYKYTYEFY
ncbi:MAG: hypothetical protein LBR08_08425 [Bacteroidales bacterium]|jgi:hypothetical protein|nr:hypothetical protein [Bacteroidales bacterium]